MALRLRDPKTLPKDGYWYIQPETGFKIGGMYSFSYVVIGMVAHRTVNNLPRATKTDASEDLDCFTCNRDPSLCYDSSVRVAETIRATTGCGSCGIKTV